MNGMLLLVGSIVYFLLAYFLYGRFVAKRFGVDPKRATPAHTQEDGIDYVPTHPAVLFGHHFASIAGAGPIIGPIVAASFGWLPAFLWIVLGCVFIGSMHDFAAMFLSVRNQGRSIAYAIEKELGYWGRQLFLFFCIAALLLVVAVFTLQVVAGFIANPSVATSSILFILMAPFFGIATNRKILTLTEASLVFVPLLFFFVWFGTVIPFDLVAIVGDEKTARTIWTIALLYYAACASIIPVWILLQPRDYLNSYLLYAMMGLGIISVVFAQPAINMATVHIPEGKSFVPNILPLLFVTIACGACSGFHALVASGTSAKQIDNERHILPVGYGGMLVEGALAVLALLSVAYLAPQDAAGVMKGAPAVSFAKGMAHFAEAVGISYNIGYSFMSLAISAFLLTSLDTATRLSRFVLQELVLPSEKTLVKPDATGKVNVCRPTPQPKFSLRQLIGNRWVSTVIVVVLSGYLALSGEGMTMWPVFGSSNQLLAALTLLAVSLWLLRKKYKALFALLPMGFMMVISLWALINLIIQNHNKPTLLSISVFLLVLAIMLICLAVKTLLARKKS